MSAQHSVSVAAVIVDDQGRILATQRRDNRHWEAPGGVLELHESIIDGVKREVLEETGLEIEVVRLTGVYKNMNLGVVALVFLANATGGTTRSTSEAVRLEWLDPSAVAEKMDQAYAVRVLDALAQTQTAVRAHNGVELLVALPALP
jgi:ADP-ribose pyrophosphatase YjhB (NUDIX family)